MRSAVQMKNSLDPQSLIERTRKNISRVPLDRGCIRSRRGDLNIRVSPNNIDRALKIMDAVIKRLAEKGAEVTIKEKDYKSDTCVIVLGEMFAIDIYEKINVAKKEKDRYGFNQYEYIPNGNLVLRIKDAPYDIRSEWKDGERKKLEEYIDYFVKGLILAAEKQKANRLERDKEKREWEAKERKEEEKQRIRQQEQALLNKLEREAMGWHKSQIIRSYIEAATVAHIQKNGKVEPGDEFDKWRTWANQQADCLDPLLRQ